MAFFSLPQNFGRIQGLALGYPYLLPLGTDQPRVYISDNENGEELFTQTQYMRVNTVPSSTVMSHPVETGSSFVDHRVVEPVELSVQIILEKDYYRSVYADISSYFNQGKLVKVHTRTNINHNMAIVSMPSEQDPETFDAITLELTFREMIFVTPSQGTMTEENQRAKADSNTVQQGQRSPGGAITGVNENAQQEALEKRMKGGT